MNAFLLLLAAAFVLFVMLRLFVTASPAQLAQLVRSAGGLLLLGLAALFLIRGAVAAAIPLAAIGVMALLRSNWGAATQPSAAQTSHVRSAGLEMSLDHDTGVMDGQVLAGRFEGRMLSDMELGDLLRLAEDFRGDEESLRLLESYLDRMHPGWREDADEGAADGPGATPGSGGMSAQEAYEILGLDPGASDTEIRAAHRRLMMQVHPDRGGSDALAAKINEAKDLLLGKHG
jgi:hypothetical protein